MRYILLAVLFLVSHTAVFGQKIVRNEKDKYTGRFVKETDMTVLTEKGVEGISVMGMSVEDNISLRLRVKLKPAFSINKGDKLYILFSNGHKVVLECSTSATAEKSGQVYTGDFSYNIDYTSREELLKGQITGMRVYTADDKYTDFDSFQYDKHDIISKLIKLLRA